MNKNFILFFSTQSLSLMLIGGGALVFSSASAMEQREFQESLKQLKKSQQLTDQKLLDFGVKPHAGVSLFPTQDENTDEERHAKKPKTLFTLHDDGKSLRAESGKLLFGQIYNRLIVGGEGSPVILELSQHQGLFSGLRVLGKARPSGTEGRMAIEFDRLITRRGSVIPIKGIAQDDAGALGLEAQVFTSKAIALAGSMAGSFITGLAASQQSQSTNSFGFSQLDRTSRNSLLQGVAQTAADQSKRLVEDATHEKSVLVVDVGTAVTLYLDEEVRF